MSDNRDALLSQWKQATAELAAWKAKEMELRKQVVEAFSTEASPGHSGTETIDVGWGYKLKIEHKLSYRLDTKDNSAAVDKALQAIERTQEGGSVIADRLVKWTPELRVSEYKMLTPVQKALIDEVLTISDATPAVSLVPPKAAK